jgi:hypothetical protein
MVVYRNAANADTVGAHPHLKGQFRNSLEDSTLTRKLLMAAVAATLVLSACGGGGPDPAEDPKGSLEAALNALSEYEGVTASLSLASDTQSLSALSEGELTDEDAQKILDSSLSFSSLNAAKPEDAEAEMSVNVAGSDGAVEMKVLGTELYLRADVRGLMEQFGADTSQLEAFEQQAGSQPGFEFVGPALAGDWIVINGLDQLQEQLGAGAATQPTEAQQEAINKFTDALKNNSDVVTGDKEGPGDHLVATVGLRGLYEDISSLAGELGAGAAGSMPPASEVPDEDIALDTWVEGGQLTQIELDLTQFKDFPDADFPDGVEALAIRLGLEEFTGGVEAPSDAAEVDVNTIMQGLMGGMGGAGAATGGPTDICAELEEGLKGQPKDVVDSMEAAYGEQCPEVFE